MNSCTVRPSSRRKATGAQRLARSMVRRPSQILLLALLAIALPAVAAQARPVVVHVKWRLVSSRVLYAAADDRFVAIMQQGKLTLLDEQTGRRRVLSRPGGTCRGSYHASTQLSFDGPWLLIACGQDALGRPEYAVYNRDTRHWADLHISSQCFGYCQVVSIGRHWAKIVTDEGQSLYGPTDYYLQNLQTGALERDPVTAGAQTRDDLNTPGGTSPLCSPLRYPRVTFPGRHDYQWEPGLLTFAGRFALSPDQRKPGAATVELHLRRCGGRLNLVIARFYLGSYEGSLGPVGGYDGLSSNGAGFTVVASSRAVISGPGAAVSGTRPNPLEGWLLPSARRFRIANLPLSASQVNGGSLLAASRYHVYVNLGGKLWAARLPTRL
jgi:hypothetical protein